MKDEKKDLTTDVLEIKKIKRILWTIAYQYIRELRWNRYINLKAMFTYPHTQGLTTSQTCCKDVAKLF